MKHLKISIPFSSYIVCGMLYRSAISVSVIWRMQLSGRSRTQTSISAVTAKLLLDLLVSSPVLRHTGPRRRN